MSRHQLSNVIAERFLVSLQCRFPWMIRIPLDEFGHEPQQASCICYREDAPTLDFAGIHVACLCGPNGHGKSALLDAITWCLWGEARGKSQDTTLSLTGRRNVASSWTSSQETLPTASSVAAPEAVPAGAKRPTPHPFYME